MNVEQEIRDAYWRLARRAKRPHQVWVELADLRPELTHVSRDALDKALREMERGPYVHLAENENQKTLTKADRAAAIRTGGTAKHLILIEA